MVASRETFPLLAELLAEQQRLDTPVARFSTAHDSGSAARVAALNSQLIPLSRPGAGERYAFEVDLDSCTGCKSCVAACHSLNGLDETETWRDVGLLVSTDRRHPFTQTVTTACHHCADPACLNGCPVLAYEQDPATGIVRHLDDQCIGCSYCVLKCPYDVPKFSARLGIVRKCDMCHSRLAAGEAPACAQACPTHAIRIVTIPATPANASDGDAAAAFLPAAPAPDYTRPTTRYRSTRALPENVRAGDAATLRPQPPHWPLVIMLTLMPLAVALSVVAALAAVSPADFVTYYVTKWPLARGHNVTYYVTLPSAAAAAIGAAGLGASVFHLGQPRRAWRIFLGWRKSWLSREALVFGAWFPLAAGAIVAPALRTAAALVGLAGLACSVMIYVDTRRRFWRLAQTAPRFFGVAAVFVLALVAPHAAAFAVIGKMIWESRTHFDRSVSARLQRGPLARAVLARDVLGLTAAVLFFAPVPGLAWLPLFAGELAERYLFFRAVDAPKMPGMPT